MSLSEYNYPSPQKTDTTSVALARLEKQPNEPRQVKLLIKYRPQSHRATRFTRPTIDDTSLVVTLKPII